MWQDPAHLRVRLVSGLAAEHLTATVGRLEETDTAGVVAASIFALQR